MRSQKRPRSWPSNINKPRRHWPMITILAKLDDDIRLKLGKAEDGIRFGWQGRSLWTNLAREVPLNLARADLGKGIYMHHLDLAKRDTNHLDLARAVHLNLAERDMPNIKLVEYHCRNVPRSRMACYMPLYSDMHVHQIITSIARCPGGRSISQ